MRFLYCENAGEACIELSDENFTHIVKSRRGKLGQILELRNLKDEYLYRYEITNIGRKSFELGLIESSASVSAVDSGLHLLWAVIDPKNIEKTLPMLNELGVNRISFFYADFSQGQFKLSFSRLSKILIQSCQQCGRSSLMDLEFYDSFEHICEAYRDFYAFDFGGEDLYRYLSKNFEQGEIWRVMIGPEGGFSPRERQSFKQILGLENLSILRSESASVFLASIARLRK